MIAVMFNKCRAGSCRNGFVIVHIAKLVADERQNFAGAVTVATAAAVDHFLPADFFGIFFVDLAEQHIAIAPQIFFFAPVPPPPPGSASGANIAAIV